MIKKFLPAMIIGSFTLPNQTEPIIEIFNERIDFENQVINIENILKETEENIKNYNFFQLEINNYDLTVFLEQAKKDNIHIPDAQALKVKTDEIIKDYKLAISFYNSLKPKGYEEVKASIKTFKTSDYLSPMFSENLKDLEEFKKEEFYYNKLTSLMNYGKKLQDEKYEILQTELNKNEEFISSKRQVLLSNDIKELISSMKDNHLKQVQKQKELEKALEEKKAKMLESNTEGEFDKMKENTIKIGKNIRNIVFEGDAIKAQEKINEKSEEWIAFSTYGMKESSNDDISLSMAKLRTNGGDEIEKVEFIYFKDSNGVVNKYKKTSEIKEIKGGKKMPKKYLDIYSGSAGNVLSFQVDIKGGNGKSRVIIFEKE